MRFDEKGKSNNKKKKRNSTLNFEKGQKNLYVHFTKVKFFLHGYK